MLLGDNDDIIVTSSNVKACLAKPSSSNSFWHLLKRHSPPSPDEPIKAACFAFNKSKVHCQRCFHIPTDTRVNTYTNGAHTLNYWIGTDDHCYRSICTGRQVKEFNYIIECLRVKVTIVVLNCDWSRIPSSKCNRWWCNRSYLHLKNVVTLEINIIHDSDIKTSCVSIRRCSTCKYKLWIHIYIVISWVWWK